VGHVMCVERCVGHVMCVEGMCGARDVWRGWMDGYTYNFGGET